MKYLLDTNVLKEVGRTTPHENVLAWLKTVDDEELVISVISVREIWKGIERKRRKDAAVGYRLEAGVQAMFDAYRGRVLPVDEAVARRWGMMLAESDKHVDDTGLAATAYVHDLVVVTRNEADFGARRVTILNPFKSSPRRAKR